MIGRLLMALAAVAAVVLLAGAASQAASLSAAARILGVNFGVVEPPAIALIPAKIGGIPVYRAEPPGRCPCPRLVISLGVAPLPGNDPQVERFIGSLAGAGFEVTLVEPGGLADGQIDRAAVEGLGAVLAQLYADAPGRPLSAGGFSVGASLLFLAATERAVPLDGYFWFGGYGDLDRLRHALRCGLILPGGDAWQPDPWAIELANMQAIERQAPLDCAVPPVSSEPGRALSPQWAAAHSTLRFPVFLLHDAADAYVPWPESVAMAASLRASRWPASVVTTDLFEHVTPRGIENPRAVADIVSTLRLLAAFLAAARG